MPAHSDNPYAAPSESHELMSRRRSCSRALSWLLAGLSLVSFLYFVSNFWFGAEIANQEYWHLIDSDDQITEIQIDGAVVSLRNAMKMHFTYAAIAFAVATLMAIGAWYTHPAKTGLSAS